MASATFEIKVNDNATHVIEKVTKNMQTINSLLEENKRLLAKAIKCSLEVVKAPLDVTETIVAD